MTVLGSPIHTFAVPSSAPLNAPTGITSSIDAVFENTPSLSKIVGIRSAPLPVSVSPFLH